LESLQELFRIGRGPSSSHTLAPGKAARVFSKRYPEGPYKVTLYGSLGATGAGHMTFEAIRAALPDITIVSKGDTTLPYHPNGMEFEYLPSGDIWRVYSTGGGALEEEDRGKPPSLYSLNSMNDILQWCQREGVPLWKYVEDQEGEGIWEFLNDIWKQMQMTLKRGLTQEGVLPGSLRLQRKGPNLFARSRHLAPHLARTAFLSAYALSVAEENAAGGMVVTAPTCGASGVLPGVLYYLSEKYHYPETSLLSALATAGLIGNLIKSNASISGAEVGCQGEVGTACAMAAAACAQLMGASNRQIEYAAEMGLEHHLGLTCDPVAGLVQIPCIERNAMAATRAVDCAEYALLSDGQHRISFDQVVETMNQTGHDIPSLYRETAQGGLAKTSLETKYTPD